MQTSDALRLCFRLCRFLPLDAIPILANWICSQTPVQHRLEDRFHDVADVLIAGTSVWHSGDLRPLKAAWMIRMPAAKDVVIFGSSRALGISAEWFQPRSMFNAAVPAGDLDEMIAFFQLCLEAGKTPRLVVLELNPTLRNPQKRGDDPLLTPYFNRALKRYGLFSWLQHLTELGSFRQFRLNLQRLRPPVWAISQEPIPQMARIYPDGTATYVPNRSNAMPGEREMDVVSQVHHIDRERVRWKTSSEPLTFDLKLLRRFLDDLQSRGIHVVVLLPPLHPVAYDFYSKLGGYDDTWIRREMAIRSIPVVGSYSPYIAKAANADFFDDVHPRAAIVHRLLSEAGVTRQ